MIPQATLDGILPHVTKPARYTGQEWNQVRKPWSLAKLTIALAYPDVYEVGMSNLGLAILYELLNQQEGIVAERVYTPWPDMEKAMRDAGIPLFSLESRRPLNDFDIVGFSLQYELNYSNVLTMLDLAGIPLHASERLAEPAAPLVIGGGTCTYNAEPLADFFDLFVIGEGEEVVLELAALYLEARDTVGVDGWKQRFLLRAAQMEGIYVPGLYSVGYRPDGTVSAVTPLKPGVQAVVRKRIVRDLPPPPVRPVVPFVQVVHDRAMIEIMRGCKRGCRFCQAGMIYRPVRERPVDDLLTAADQLLSNTGHEEIALVSLSSTDYTAIERLVRELSQRYAEKRISISLPSLRTDTFSIGLARMIQRTRKTGLTFAPEAGSERLRCVINKGVTAEDLLRTAEAAYASGWQRIKLYFMLGLPTETMEDVLAIADLVMSVRSIGRRERGRRAQVNVSVNTFVPKPHTPFQWLPLESVEAIGQRQQALRRALRSRAIKLSWSGAEETWLEAALSRGDRRLGQVILRAWQRGARFDAWNEWLRPEVWRRAFADSGLNPSFYTTRQREQDETFPWDHIDTGVRKSFLWEEYQRALGAEPSVNCAEGCMGCGIQLAFQLAECPMELDHVA
jgi:radical SAM family uncharacterized protein